MLKRIKEKLKSVGRGVLICFAVLCGFSVLVGFGGALYNIILIGVVLKGGLFFALKAGTFL